MKHSSHSQRVRWGPAIAGACVVLAQAVTPALAQQTHYTDVSAGAYYENAAAALLDLGALDARESRLRPGDLATRAELVKLLVNLKNEPLLYPSRSSFSDVALSAWYSPYFEAAAHVGWVRGDGNCYQTFRPCTARPPAPVNRAEAAALLVRAFNLERTGLAPQFPDNPQDQWYYSIIQTAADHCVLQGDGGTGRVRPAASMNRAEMIVMFHRASMNMEYGVDCGVPRPTAGISSVLTLSPTRLRVTFTDAVNAARVEDESRYTVRGAANIGVRSATRVSSSVVDLDLTTALRANASYTLSVENMATAAGVIFSDIAAFSFVGEAGDITNVTAVSSTRVRLSFSTDVTASYAEDESRYTVARSDGGGTLGIRTATRLDSRTVELALSSDLSANVSYRVHVANLQTTAGVFFSDSASFVFPAPTTGHIIDVAATSATRIRLIFDVDLDGSRAEQAGRFVVTDGNRTLSLRSANLLDDRRTVELTLADTLTNQRAYTVYAQELQTSAGVFFTDSATLLYDAGVGVNFAAMLTGIQEIPPRITTATGTGTFVLTSAGLQYDVTVQNLSGSITSAHFHEGESGVAGGIVMPITFVGGRATGTWTGMTDAHRNALLDRRIYVNVHTAQYPEGEIRGQVLPQ